MKLAEIGEFGFIDRIREMAPPGPHQRLGIGDDCAAQVLAPGELLLTTTDMLIEEVHFRKEWTDMRSLGRKSVTVNVSDIAAMGGEARALFLALGIPPQTTVEELDQFIAGFSEAAASYGAVLAGGDTCRSPGPLIISVTAEGAVPEREMLRRDGAGQGDAIYVTGTLGDSALALQLLRQGRTFDPWLRGRHNDPTARVQFGRALSAEGIASAMLDISDGLLQDLGHILKASGAGAHIEVEALPLSSAFRKELEASADLVDLALCGGEDYELLFTVPPAGEGRLKSLAAEHHLPVTRVGTVRDAESGLQVKAPGGAPWKGAGRGFNHFSPA